MEPPGAAAAQQSYGGSAESSPRSRTTDTWDDPMPQAAARLRLMCSYGGHIVPRPHDKSLCYVGGDTRIVVVERTTSLAELCNRLGKTLLNGRPFTLKYQLPSEDLDSLISVTTDEDLDNMIDEFDRTAATAAGGSAARPSRIRLFLFPLKPDTSQSMGPILDNMPTKSDDWFLSALNGASAGMLNRGFSDSASVNCLLGLDDDGIGGGAAANNSETNSRCDAEPPAPAKGRQDIHSVPDSPMMENSSSFGSTSSSPSLANLPPIRVHVEDQRMGIEEQFAQMSVGMVSQAPPMPTAVMPPAAPVSPAPDYSNRVVSDDERSDHGGQVAYRKQPPPQPQQQQQNLPPQSQPKSTAGFDLPSPDSVSSDHSLSNVMSRPKPVIYQDPVAQIASGATRFPADLVDTKVQQQVPDSGYVLQHQYDQQRQSQQLQQQQTQQLQQQQAQQLQQQHAQQLQQQPLQQQQFMHPGGHYIPHQTAGSVPLQAYYHPVYPSQQQQQQPQHLHHPQLDQQQQYQVYYMPTRQAQPYGHLPVQQSLQPNLSEASSAATIASSRSQPTPNPTMVSPTAAYSQMRNAPMAKPEIAAGVYRTATTAAAPSLVQVPSAQHQPQQQYVGYAQMNHPSQSTVPTSTVTPNYAYEYADPSQAQHSQIYYTQPLAPTMQPSHYQTMTAAAAMGLPEVSGQLPSDNIKQQQQQQR